MASQPSMLQMSRLASRKLSQPSQILLILLMAAAEMSTRSSVYSHTRKQWLINCWVGWRWHGRAENG